MTHNTVLLVASLLSSSTGLSLRERTGFGLSVTAGAQGLGSLSGSSVDKRLKGFGSSQQVGGKTKEKESFYSTCECIFL